MKLSKFELFTLIIASWGAVLSTVLGFIKLMSFRRKVRVKCYLSIVPFPSGKVAEFISIEAINLGSRPVEIQMATLKLSGGQKMIQTLSLMGPIPLPKKLGDSESITVFYDLPEILNALKKYPNNDIILAHVKDSTGKVYTSKVPKIFFEKGFTKGPRFGYFFRYRFHKYFKKN